MSKIIPIQLELEPYFPEIRGSKDYRDFQFLLSRIETLLEESGIEQKAISLQRPSEAKDWSLAKRMNFHGTIRTALRCNIVRHLTGASFRGLAVRLADSFLLLKFCGLLRIGQVKISSKSTLEVYSKLLDESVYRDLVRMLLKQASEISP